MTDSLEEGAACKHHPDRPAAAVCQRCSTPLCESCAQTLDAQMLCPECRFEPTHATGAAASAPGPGAETIGLFHVEPEEAKEILGTVIGSAIVGALCGYLWGGLHDPWRAQGVLAAGLNLVLFGLWGCFECGGVVLARNLKLVRSRGGFLLAAALAGGAWVAVFAALDLATNPEVEGPPAFRAVFGLLGGFVIGAGISALCTIKLTGLIKVPAASEAAPPAPTGGDGAAGETTAPQAGLTRGWKIAIGCGLGCLAVFLVALVLVGGCLYQGVRDLDRMQQEQKAMETEAAGYVPTDREVFGKRPAGDFFLEIDGDPIDAEVTDFTAGASSPEHPLGGFALITIVFSAAASPGSQHLLQVRIKRKALEAVEPGQTVLLNDPRLIDDPEWAYVQFDYPPAGRNFTSDLGPAGEGHRQRRKQVFGRVLFGEVGARPGQPLSGTLEAQLVPYDRLPGEGEEPVPVAKVFCRFRVELVRIEAPAER